MGCEDRGEIAAGREIHDELGSLLVALKMDVNWLDKRLADREYLAGSYSIADIASYPWIVGHERQSQDLKQFPHLKRWFEAIRARPATQRAYARAQEVNPPGAPQPTAEQTRKILYGQDASTVQRPSF